MPNSNPGNDACGTLLDQEQPPVRVEDANASKATDREGKDLKKASTSRRKRMLMISIAAVVALVGAYFVWNAFQYEDTDDAQVDGHIMPLSARITGHVEKVNFIEGQIVHAGAVLVVIDSRDYQVATDQAVANLANAEANSKGSHDNVPITFANAYSGLDSAQAGVTNAQAGVAGAEHNLEADQAELLEARANAGKTDSDLVRYEQLVQKEDISRQQYDGAVAAAQANRAMVTSGEAVVAAAEQSLDQAQGKLLQARADLRNAKTAPQQVLLIHARAQAADAQALQSKAQLAQARLNLSYTIIRSPVTGIVGRKSVEVGQNVSVGQELLEVVPLDDVWVTANFKETQLRHMRPGQTVEVNVDAYGRTWRGHVTNLGGGTGSVFSLLPPENATGNYVKIVQRVPVRIDFDHSQTQDFNAEGLLKPGLSVEPDVRVR